MTTVAEIVEEAMARKGMTQQRLAEEIGKTPAWVNMILRQGKQPGWQAVLRMAEVLEINCTRLVQQAHYERAYEAWKPYLAPEPDEDMDGPGTIALTVIGTASAGHVYIKVDLEKARHTGELKAADAPGEYLRPAGRRDGRGRRRKRVVGFHPDCMAIKVLGDGLEPVAYDGQYIVVSPLVRKEDIPDGSIVYVTYEVPGETEPRATIARMYRYRIAGDEKGSPGLPIYNLVPVNTRLKRKGHGPEPVEAVILRHRQVREMFPVVGVIFENMIEGE